MGNGIENKGDFLVAHLDDVGWHAAARLVDDLLLEVRRGSRTEARRQGDRESAAQAEEIRKVHETCERLACAIEVWPKSQWASGGVDSRTVGSLSEDDLEHAILYYGGREQAWSKPSAELEALMIERERRRRGKEEQHEDHK